jgi:uncharacterized repeat protein (TIGR01451 family)
MDTMRNAAPIRRAVMALVLATALASAVRAAAASPDFDAVSWQPMGCQAANLVSHTSPAGTDFAGNATYPAAYYAFDSTYLYFRYRMDGDPSGPGGFAQYAWTALMQVPSGNPFQYQYELALDGQTDVIQIWQNTTASDIAFSPLFHDTPETNVFAQPYALANGSTVNTTPLARSLQTGDGSHFGNSVDYFIDFAIPVAALQASGAIATASDLGSAFFFPATSTNGNNYNKGYLNCPFLPSTNVALSKTVEPAAAPANATTSLTYTIVASNTGTRTANGLVITDVALPAYMTNVAVAVSSDDPGATWTVVGTNPLDVKVNSLAAGTSVTVVMTADATPTCSNGDFTNVASVFASNAMTTTGSALLSVHPAGVELCDGKDNDCNGLVDDGGASASCSDGDVCNGAEVCVAGSCQPGAAPSCDDGNSCTTDSCDATAGCLHTPLADGTACDDGSACTQADSCQAGSCVGASPVVCTALDECHAAGACDPATGVCSNPAALDGTACDDGNACTTGDACHAGACTSTAIPGCGVCTTAADCSDGNACTTDICDASGTCSHANVAGCTPCTTAADCDDHDACTQNACGADGSCMITAIPGCQRCTTVADCDDGDSCTTDSCTDGACRHDALAQCEPKPVEICGNCIDDDGDGLVDAEDPDCCDAPAALDLRSMKIRRSTGKAGNRLRVKARYAASAPADFDPMHQDTQVQISDANGQIFCQTVTADHWTHKHRPVFRFKDKTRSFAGGLKIGKFRMKRNGEVMFRTRGKQLALAATDGRDVQVTVRVGNRCATSEMSLHSKRKALVFP